MNIGTLSKIQGGLIGGAIGDSLGFISEMKPRTVLLQFIKELKSGHLKTLTHRTYPKNYIYGQYSDDTQFTLFFLESLLKMKGLNQNDYLQSLSKQHKAKKLIGIGGATKSILERVNQNQSIQDINKNNSNGALMRSSAVGLFFKSPQNILDAAQKQSQITHDHPESILTCQVQSLTVHLLMQGKTNSELRQVWSTFLDTSFLDLSLRDFLKTIKSKFPSKTWSYIPPSALATLMGVLYVFYHQRGNFESSITLSLFLGGDTDSVASLVGTLMGVDLGLENIPLKFRGKVHDQGNRDENFILTLASQVMNNQV